MKLIISVFIISVFTNQVTAQIAVSNQPDSSYYSMVVNTCKRLTPTEFDMINVKPNTIPLAMLDTLKKYDWFVIGSFGYTEATLRTPFSKLKDQFNGDSYQFDFKRYCKDGVVGEFYLQKTSNDIKNFFTNTFDKATASKMSGIKKAGTKTYLQTITYGESEFEQIVFYKNKILVVDITMNGKMTDKKVKYRKMLYGVEQKFDW